MQGALRLPLYPCGVLTVSQSRRNRPRKNPSSRGTNVPLKLLNLFDNSW